MCEDHDQYSRVVILWQHSEAKATRIIADRSNIQWIIQHRTPSGRWMSKSFCRTRVALERLLPGKADEIRSTLPETFAASTGPASLTEGTS